MALIGVCAGNGGTGSLHPNEASLETSGMPSFMSPFLTLWWWSRKILQSLLIDACVVFKIFPPLFCNSNLVLLWFLGFEYMNANIRYQPDWWILPVVGGVHWGPTLTKRSRKFPLWLAEILITGLSVWPFKLAFSLTFQVIGKDSSSIYSFSPLQSSL